MVVITAREAQLGAAVVQIPKGQGIYGPPSLTLVNKTSFMKQIRNFYLKSYYKISCKLAQRHWTGACVQHPFSSSQGTTKKG